MAEKGALLVWRVWAFAAAVGTALPAARLVSAQSPAPGPSGDLARAGLALPAEPRSRTAPAIERAPEATEALLLALAQADTGPERCSLCEQLPALDDPRVTYAITSVLERTRLKSVRACAARALSLQPTTEARSWLVDLVDDPQTEVHRAALGALAAADDDAARIVVVEATHSENPEIRLSAVAALLEARRPEGFEAAAVVLPTLEDRDASLMLIDALGTSGDARALPVLQRLIEEGENEAHLHAIAALGELGSPLALPLLDPLLAVGSDAEFDHALGVLRKLDPDSVFDRLQALLGSGNERRESRVLAAIFDSKTAPASALMHEILRSGDEARLRAVFANLRRRPDPSFEADLTALAERAQGAPRELALGALYRLDTNSARATTQRLDEPDDPEERKYARQLQLTRSLGRLARDPSEAAQTELLTLLDKADLEASAYSAVVLRAPVSTVEHVLARLDGLPEGARHAVIHALARRQDPRFAPVLRAAMRDPLAWIRTSAREGLLNLGDASMAQEADHLKVASDAEGRAAAIDLLATRRDDAATRDIVSLAGDEDVEVASSALRTLDSHAPERVLPLALRAFQGSSSEDRLTLLSRLDGVRQSVVRPLNELALSDANDEVVVSALQNLTALEGAASAQQLLAVASDANRSEEVRSVAARGLRKLGGPLARSNRGLLDTLSPAEELTYSCDLE